MNVFLRKKCTSYFVNNTSNLKNLIYSEKKIKESMQSRDSEYQMKLALVIIWKFNVRLTVVPFRVISKMLV